MIIYRVVAVNGPFVSKWFATRKACIDVIKNIKNNEVSKFMFGSEFKIEKSELSY